MTLWKTKAAFVALSFLFPAPGSLVLRHENPSKETPPQRLEQTAVEEMSLPLDLQIPYLFKALAYELDHAGDFRKNGYRIGIVYAPDQVQSVFYASEFARYVVRQPADYKITPLAIPFSSIDQFREIVISNQLNVIYVCPGNSRNLNAIVEVSKQILPAANRLRVITTTGVDEYVKQGIGIGFFGQPDPRDKKKLVARYSVNKLAVLSAGARFDADFVDQALRKYQ